MSRERDTEDEIVMVETWTIHDEWVGVDREAAHRVAEQYSDLPENTALWHAIADEILKAALSVEECDERSNG